MPLELIIRIIADYSLFVVGAISAYALIFKIPRGGRAAAYGRIIMAGLTSLLLAKLIAVVYQPSLERPFELLGLEAGAAFVDNPGFPSDHALIVTVLALAVWFETRLKKTTIVLVSLVAIIAVGRVLALVHTPLDVTAGIAIGLVGALWYIQKPGGQNRQGHRGKNHRK